MTRPDGWKVQAVGVAGSAFLTGLGATLRFRIKGREPLDALRGEGKGVIFALWHSRLLSLVHLHRGEGVVALVSQHRDGEYIAQVMRRRGFEAARGSSTRGGAKGLRELIRVSREGRDLAVTVDGPRGPARVAKGGVITLARMTGLPVICVSAGARSAWRAASWDRFEVPRPFTRVAVRYAPPIRIPREMTDAEAEEARLELQATLDHLTDEADRAVRGLPQENGE